MKIRWQRLVSLPFLALIGGYQKLISPLLPPSCIYYPSCSEYSKQAIVKHGVWVGSLLMIQRILRCNPLFQGGVDDVPENPKFFQHRKHG